MLNKPLPRLGAALAISLAASACAVGVGARAGRDPAGVLPLPPGTKCNIQLSREGMWRTGEIVRHENGWIAFKQEDGRESWINLDHVVTIDPTGE